MSKSSIIFFACFVFMFLPFGRRNGLGNEPQVLAAAEEKEETTKDKDKEEADESAEPKTESEKKMQEDLEKKACPTVNVKFSTETDKNTHPTPEPTADKAMVYVIRPTMFGNKIQTKLAVDGHWQGVNRGNNYFYFMLDPGEHYFCSQAENKSVKTLQVEAGKTYYLQQKVKMGLMKARNTLVALSEQEGQEGLAKCHPSSWQEKK